ncbi:MAG: response regulator [Verrucomicrobia bacterium]|nr:response regulator [Verrucomicrobiota bacterium]
MSLQTIYLVEDNKDNADLFRDLLSDHFSIRLFKTGMELLDYLGASDPKLPDLFVFDISLPGLDGVSLMKKIRSDYTYQGIPILAVTAHAMADDESRLIQAGFDWYLSKPILDEKELFHVVDGLMSKSRI